MMIIGNSFLFGFCQIYSVNIPLYILLYSQILFYFPVLFFIFDAIKLLRIHKYRKRQGEANYFEEKKDKRRVIDIVRASSSLPFVCPITYVDGIPMLDGGIVDSIPLQRAITDGCTRNVVVLTRNRGYRKDSKDIRIPSFVYRKYPKLREALSRRCAVYNEQLEMVERMEDEGQIIVIRPLKPVAVDRIEKDVQKLTEFYQEGYECARALLEE